MTTIDDAAEVIGRYAHRDFAEDAARDLAAEGHLTPAPTIIRTVEELKALDPETLLFRWDSLVVNAGNSYGKDIFPAVVILPAEQVRAALKALEEA